MSRILVIGAHTAVGKAFIECLEERDLADDVVRSTTLEHVGPELELIEAPLIASSDVVVLAMRGDIVQPLTREAQRWAKPVLDLAGAFALGADAAYVWPGFGPVRAADGPTSTVAPISGPTAAPISGPIAAPIALVPLGPAAPLVAVLASLAHLSPRRVFITTLESAASQDQAGMDELSDHVRAVFGMREAVPELFGASLAFDAIPSVAGRTGSAFDADEDLVKAVRDGFIAVTGRRSAPEVLATRVLVPTFSAEAAVVEVEVLDSSALGRVSEDKAQLSPHEVLSRDVVARALMRGPGLRFTDALLPALDAVGRDDTLVGRLRVSAGRIGLWLAYDRLRRGGPTLAALWIEQRLAG